MNIQKWLDENCQDLWGKRIAVTGSTGGLGQELCAYLASCGASLVLLDRNCQRSDAHKQRLMQRFGNIDVECIPLDLESIVSAKRAVSRLTKADIDIFIHNAGAYSIPRKITDSGYMNIFQINFLAPYYMICELLPHLRNKKGRVVVVGSIAHNYSRIDEKNIDFSGVKADSKVYGNAKRYLMFSLFELFKNETQASLSVTHPGIAFTNITAHYPKFIFWLIKNPMKIIFSKPKKAVLSILLGVFEKTEYCEWIGPHIFNVWGYPKKKKLHTASVQEIKQISKNAQKIYSDCQIMSVDSENNTMV